MILKEVVSRGSWKMCEGELGQKEREASRKERKKTTTLKGELYWRCRIKYRVQEIWSKRNMVKKSMMEKVCYEKV